MTMGNRCFRAFTLRDGILHSAVHTWHRWPGPGPDFTAACEHGGDHEPPAADCTCGLYVWTSWWPGACLRTTLPGVYGEVEVTGRVAPVADTCPVYRLKRSVRVGSFRLRRLFVLVPPHCVFCADDPRAREVTDGELAALADRYGVPAERWYEMPDPAAVVAAVREALADEEWASGLPREVHAAARLNGSLG
jgi:hypothetical protein